MTMHYLYADEDHLHVITASGDKRQEAIAPSFGWGDRDLMQQWFERLSPKDRVILIVDYVDETLHREWVPKIHPWEKIGIEKRFRDKALFEGALFSHVRWLKERRKIEEGRHEQALMMSSIYRNESIAFLLDAMETQQASLTAIYSYAFLAEQYFFRVIAAKHKLNRKRLSAPFMLLIRESTHAFRQMFIDQGSLRISRHLELDPELEGETEKFAVLMQEMDVAIQYLYNQRTLPPNAEVGLVYISTQPDEGEQVRTLFLEKIAKPDWDLAHIPVCTLSIDALGKFDRMEKISQPGLLPYLIQYIKQQRPVSFYKPPYVARVQKLQTIRSVLLAASVLLGALGAMILAEKAIDTLFLNEKTLALQAKQQGLNQQLETLSSYSYPEINAADMQASVEFTQAVMAIKDRKAVGVNLALLAQVISRHSHIQLEDIRWRQKGALDSHLKEVILSGWVTPFNGQYEMPVRWVDQFLEELKQQSSVIQAELTKEPLNRKLENAVSVNSAQSPVVNGLPFEITLVMEEG